MSGLLKKLLNENKRIANSYFEVEKLPLGRTLIIPDIHGCIKTLKALIAQVNLSKDDQLFFLGDYIDRGPDSIGIIDYIIELMNENYNVYPVRGNHEQKLLDYYSAFRIFKIYDPDFDEEDYDNNQLNEYLKFMSNLPIYYRIQNNLLVHAGFNGDCSNPLLDYDSMMTIRDFEITWPNFNYRIFHGHTPKSLMQIEMDILNTKQVINLDNGCFYTKDENFGRLLCFDVDNSILYKAKNIDYSIKN